MNSRIIALSALIIGMLVIGTVSAVPPVPCGFWGNVTIDDSPAPAGTEITAKLNSEERGSIITTSLGIYGGAGIYGEKLMVSAREGDHPETAPEITFWVDGNMAQECVPFISNSVVKLDLAFESGGSGPDVPPHVDENGKLSFDWIVISEEADGQHVKINTTMVRVTTGDRIITIEQPGNGWKRILIRTEGMPQFDMPFVSGMVSNVTFTSPEIGADPESASIEIFMKKFPETGKIFGTVSDKPDKATESAFVNYVKGSKKNVKSVGIACVLDLRKTGISNAGDGGIIRSAVIRMTAAKSWVNANGGIENVVILRRADDGSMSALKTSCMLVGDLYQLEAESPEGLSVFALAGVEFSSTGGGGTGGGGTGGSGGGPPLFDPQTPVATPVTVKQTPVSFPNSKVDDIKVIFWPDGRGTSEANVTSQQENGSEPASGSAQPEEAGIPSLLTAVQGIGGVGIAYLLYRRKE